MYDIAVYQLATSSVLNYLTMPENINYVISMTSQYNYLPIQKERYEHELQKVRSSSARSQAKSALTVFELKDENTKLLEENTKLLSEKAPDHEGSVFFFRAFRGGNFPPKH